ncbi:beta-N-acetylhexosaminidase [Pseudalkalibacillus decolorationis]|uniref:beta-N-acetylhexosaminidase n=1 Tax=Pseudalkalibacillus decolorationis TaxID=163879 RepID=UPI002147C2A2|nr:beta-N-acetylhexosaminidase [Pseudalkalibacillus decolorationis]
MRWSRNLIIGFLITCLILGVGIVVSLLNDKEPVTVTWDDVQENGAKVEAFVERMTINEKVGQLLMPAIRKVDNKPVTTMQPEIKKMIDDFTPGGIILFRENVESRQQVKLLNSKLQEQSKLPLMISIDQEGGLVTRLPYFPDLQGNMALGATGNNNLASKTGEILGEELRNLGIHIDFAPSVDMNINPLNPVIGIRSFGDDPKQVGEMGTAFMKGLNEAGVIAVAKHFPGHGGVDSDSHYVLPVHPKSLEELRNSELKPFQTMINEGVQGIMTAHITFPEIETTQLDSQKDGLPVHLPATLSPRMINDILRDEMNYKGLVFTDAMNMKAISEHFGSGEAAVRAILAGADVIVMPDQLKVAYDALLEAVKSERITEERLNESVVRILKAKQQFVSVETEDGQKSTTIEKAIQLEKTVAEQSVTLLKNEQVLPLEEDFEGSIAIISSSKKLLDSMKNALWEHHYQFELIHIDSFKNQNGELVEEQTRKLKRSNLTIFVTDSATIVGDSKNAWELISLKKAMNDSQQTILVMARNPYDLTVLPEIDAAIAQYSAATASFQVTADVIFGKQEALGTLPVKLPWDE